MFGKPEHKLAICVSLAIFDEIADSLNEPFLILIDIATIKIAYFKFCILILSGL
jgi:hypothetical protein